MLTGSPAIATGVGVISSLLGGEHNSENSEKIIEVKKTNNLSHSLANFYKKTKIQNNEINIPNDRINLQNNDKTFKPQNIRVNLVQKVKLFEPKNTNYVPINRYSYDYDEYIIPKKKKIKKKLN